MSRKGSFFGGGSGSRRGSLLGGLGRKGSVKGSVKEQEAEWGAKHAEGDYSRHCRLYDAGRDVLQAQASASPQERNAVSLATRPLLMHTIQCALAQKRLAKIALERAGKLRYLITQNVDGLDQRAGFPRGKMAVLHGCVFEEKCEDCAKIFFRDDDVGTISFQPTGRRCEACGGVLRDMLLDWEDPLPEDEFERSGDECEAADGLQLTHPSLATILYLDDEPHDLKPGMVVFIAGGTKHSLYNESETEDFVLLTMWEKADYNGVHHARIKAWGTSFKTVDED